MRWQFIQHWAMKIPSLQIVIASFEDFSTSISESKNGALFFRIFHFIEHPLANHWQGNKETREWLFDGLQGEYHSFFKFWNTAQKRLKKTGIETSFGL